jgi:predicted transcriptional regulator
MPRIDDPNINLKKGKAFKRKSLRPWDNFDDFKPRIIENQLVNNQETIGKQLVNNQETIRKQGAHLIGKQLVNNKEKNIELVNNQETISKPIGKQEAPPISKQLVNQLVNKESTHARTLEAVKQLCGLQRNLLFYIVEDCKSIGLLHTMPITNESLRILLNTDAHSVKTTVQRLTKKGMINRKEGKSGRGGYTIFAISESVRNAVIETHGQLSISKQLVNQLVNANGKQLVNNWETNGITNPLSSSSIDLKTTTTNYNPARELAEAWQVVEYSLLANIGFTQTHLLQLSKLKPLDPSIVQDSIYHFAFDLKHNNKASGIKGDPLNYFMGIVSKRGAYTAPSNYIDPVLEVMNSYHKTKEQSEKQKAEIEQKVQEIEFSTWHDNLSDSEVEELIPSEIRNGFGATPTLRQTLKIQFLKKY